MPGIVGIITKMPCERATAELRRMVNVMRHEDFYVTGTWIDEELGLYAGWVEREESCSGPMPQRSETGGKTLLFVGDDFPEPGVALKLRRNGHTVAEDPNGHLVHLAEEDASFPAGLNGQFQGILADRALGAVTLFNDRYGLRRVYCHETDDAFYFGAEAKALLAVKPELRVIDPRSAGEYVACGCVLEDRTLFKGIHVLPWASAWIFRHGKLEVKQRYYSAQDWESQPAMEKDAYHRELRDTFERDLPRFFSNPKRIGLSLTGGLDTRLILAWQKPEPHSLPCYTFGGVYRESRDMRIARRVADTCAQTHHAILVGDEFLGRFPEYAERSVFLADGCAGVQHSADLYINQIARQIAPIRMTGNYGDQVLRHLTVFKPSTPASEWFDPEFFAHVTRASENYAHCMRGHRLTVATTRQMSWYYQGLLALELSQVSMRTPYLDNGLVQLLYRAPESTLANNNLRVQLIEDGWPALRKIRSDLGFAGTGGPVVEEYSRLFQRLTMRAEYAFEWGNPQWLANFDRRLLGRMLERRFVGMHKFTHFALWYRGVLAKYVREMLLDSRSLGRAYLQKGAVHRLVQRQLTGDSNDTPMIHKLLNLEYIHRLFIESR